MTFFPPQVSSLWQKVGANATPHIFVGVRVYLSFQQRQQVVKATGEVLFLHLYKQTTNLSPETLQIGLGGQGGGQREE